MARPTPSGLCAVPQWLEHMHGHFDKVEELGVDLGWGMPLVQEFPVKKFILSDTYVP